jgi:putative MATE family efflux protein
MSQRGYREIPGMFDGRILPVTLRVGLPILIGNVLQFVYALVDTFFISRIDPSSTALLSGTGLMFPLFFFIMAVAMSLSVGVSTLVGRAVGEKNEAVARDVTASALLLVLLIAVPTLAAGHAFGDRLVRILAGGKLTEQALGYGLEFFRYLLPGLGIMVFGQMLNGVLQGQGLTGVIAKAAVIATVTNMVLDPLCIFGLGMGVAGAGTATTIAVSTSALYVIATFVRGGSAVPLDLRFWRARGSLMREILRVALPHFLSMASLSVSFMLFNKLVGTIGEDAMNAWTLVGRMDQAVMIPSFAVAGATSVMISQNYGRNRLDRVRAIYARNLLLAVSVVATAAIGYMLVAPYLFATFSHLDRVVQAAARQVRLLALTFVGVSVAIISSSTFNATGRPLPALALSVARMGLVALPLAFLLELKFGMGMNGVYWALGVGNLLALPLALVWTRRHLAALKFRTVG